MTRIVLLRHGYSVANSGRFFSGQTDVALEPIGFKQAESAARYIVKNYKIDKIYSSDLSRAYNTALPTAKALSLPIETSEKLREIDVGVWAGLTGEKLMELYPKEYSTYSKDITVHCVGGESYGDLIVRATTEIKRIVSENDGKTVLVATHGGFTKALLFGLGYNGCKEIKDIPIVGNTAITVLDFEDGKVTFVDVNNNKHLEDENL